MTASVSSYSILQGLATSCELAVVEKEVRLLTFQWTRFFLQLGHRVILPESVSGLKERKHVHLLFRSQLTSRAVVIAVSMVSDRFLDG